MGTARRVIGIDPGLTGAIAVVQCYDGPGSFAQVIDMPLRQERGRRVLDPVRIVAILRGFAGECRRVPVMVESQWAHPAEGVTSSFRMGESFGLLKGLCVGSTVPEFDVLTVSAVRWKRHFGLLKTGKDGARQYALERFPALQGQLSRKKDHGRGDSLLVALYVAETAVGGPW